MQSRDDVDGSGSGGGGKQKNKQRIVLKGALSSLSISPDAAFVAAAGRETISVVQILRTSAAAQIEDDEEEDTSAAAEQRRGSHRQQQCIGGGGSESGWQYSFGSERHPTKRAAQTAAAAVCSVAWHPHDGATIATSAVSGAVHVWRVGDARIAQAAAFAGAQQWKRRTNRLCWHPTDPALLLLAVQDGSVKLLDWRAHEQMSMQSAASSSSSSSSTTPLLRFPRDLPSRAASVRDVRFAPHDAAGLHFVSAMEDGSVRLWDTRKQAAPLCHVQAHLRMAVSLDWHPVHRGVFASCGSDGVKVWNVQHWPGSGFGGGTGSGSGSLASSYSSQQPRPLFCMHSTSSVAAVRWRTDSPDEIASCASTLDFKVYLWNVRRRFVPLAQFCGHTDVTTDFAWLDADTVVSCSKDATLRINTLSMARKPFESIRTVALSVLPQGSVAAAKEFVDRRAPVSQEEVAALPNPFLSPEPSLQQSSGASERPVAVLSSVPNLIDGVPNFMNPSDDDAIFKSMAQLSFIGAVDTQLSQWEICEHNARVCEFLQRPQFAQVWRLARCAFEPTPDIDDPPAHEPQHLSFDPSAIFSSAADTVDSKQSAQQGSLSAALPSDDPAADSQQQQQGGGGEFLVTAPHQDELPDLIRAETVVPLLDLPDLRAFASQTTAGAAAFEGPAADEGRLGDNAQLIQRDWALPSRMLQDAVLRTLCALADAGEVQVCALVALVLGPQAVPAEQASRWVLGYLTILQRLQMHVKAAEVVQSCGAELSAPHLNFGDGLATLSKKATTIKVGRPDSKKHHHQQKQTSATAASRCAVCHLPVRGLFAWCQGCGHGGHLSCLHAWFEGNRCCPTGCTHLCRLAATDATASPALRPAPSPL